MAARRRRPANTPAAACSPAVWGTPSRTRRGSSRCTPGWSARSSGGFRTRPGSTPGTARTPPWGPSGRTWKSGASAAGKRSPRPGTGQPTPALLMRARDALAPKVSWPCVWPCVTVEPRRLAVRQRGCCAVRDLSNSLVDGCLLGNERVPSQSSCRFRRGRLPHILTVAVGGVLESPEFYQGDMTEDSAIGPDQVYSGRRDTTGSACKAAASGSGAASLLRRAASPGNAGR